MAEGTGNTQQGQQDSGGGFESTNPFVEVQFTDTSSGADSVLWNFGDGNASTERNPRHKFYANGNYNITLTVTNSAGEAVSQESVQIAGIGDNTGEGEGNNGEGEVIYGCTDPAATNYDANATQDNGSCQYPPPQPPEEETSEWPDFLKQQGILNLDMLMQSQFYQYTATDYEDMIEMGVITLEQANIILTLLLKPTITPGGNQGGGTTTKVYGCTDPNATNYNSLANEDDGSCTYAAAYSYELTGQMNNRQYNSINNTTSLFIVLNSVNSPGLIPQIQNYVNVLKAIRINGSLTTITNFEYNSSDNSGRITIQGNMGNSSASDVNPTTAYNFEMIIESDTELDTNTSGNTSGDTGGDTGGDDGIRGCTDPQADNFNRFATIDDGSCEYSSGY